MRKGMLIIDSIRNNQVVADIIARHQKYLPDDWKTLWVNDKRMVSTIAEYNMLLTTYEFWEACPFDKVLIIQHDSGLLREGIDDFLEWDYIGSPWKFQEHGGNGGLSLRSRDAMMKVIEKHLYKPILHGNEDVYFSNFMQSAGCKLAPREVCMKFSCESIYQLGTLGYHAINKHLNQSQIQNILNQYDYKAKV